MRAEDRSVAAPVAPKGPLLVRLCNWVGEVVLSLPALRRLEEAGYTLHLYGKGWAPALLEGAGWPVTVRRGGLGNAVMQLRQLRRTLACGGPAPRSLLMTKSFSSALEMRLAGLSPSGYARDGRTLLLHHAYALPRFAHETSEYWHLVNCFLGSQAPFPASLGWAPSGAQLARAQALLKQHNLNQRPFVLLCPFSGADDHEDRKVWPGFKALATALAAAGVPSLICPGPGEEKAAAELAPQAICLPGVDLGVYGALLAQASRVVANDTGPGHLAAAAGAALISICGPQSVPAWTPVGDRIQLFQDASGWPPVERVLAAMGMPDKG
jgi:heptosyltransferase II